MLPNSVKVVNLLHFHSLTFNSLSIVMAHKTAISTITATKLHTTFSVSSLIWSSFGRIDCSTINALMATTFALLFCHSYSRSTTPSLANNNPPNNPTRLTPPTQQFHQRQPDVIDTIITSPWPEDLDTIVWRVVKKWVCSKLVLWMFCDEWYQWRIGVWLFLGLFWWCHLLGQGSLIQGRDGSALLLGGLCGSILWQAEGWLCLNARALLCSWIHCATLHRKHDYDGAWCANDKWRMYCSVCCRCRWKCCVSRVHINCGR